LASGGAIREAAALLFLEKGYQGTSMDEIAARAGVSKQTIYTHFPNKEVLFQDLVLGNAGRVEEFTSELRRTFAESADLAAGLREVARLYTRFVIRPEVLRLRRLVLGEAGRFPGLARRYYELVPAKVYEALAQLFGELSERGLLSVDDPALAAHHFAWLALGLPMDVAMFDEAQIPGPAELDRLADAAARVFLAAYAGGRPAAARPRSS
jgi:TetR/AcrR family transcriptional repressor of mexJK operon